MANSLQNEAKNCLFWGTRPSKVRDLVWVPTSFIGQSQCAKSDIHHFMFNIYEEEKNSVISFSSSKIQASVGIF